MPTKADAPSKVLLKRAEVGATIQDVRIGSGHGGEIGSALRPVEERVIDAEGGALIPGLHDHHLHLLSLAASLDSLQCGPPEVDNRDLLIAKLRWAARSATRADW